MFEQGLQMNFDDIRFLLTLPDVDREKVKGYFLKYDMEQLFEQITKTL